MADGTTFVKVTSTQATPEDYLLSGAASLDLLAVAATFDGSGAAGDFVPVVQVINEAGEVMLTFRGETETAGDSASYTFAPFLKATTSGDGGGGLGLVGYSALTGPSKSIASGAAATLNAMTDSGPDTYFLFGSLRILCQVAGVFAFQINIETTDTTAPTVGSIAQCGLARAVGAPAVACEVGMPLADRFFTSCSLWLPPVPYAVGDSLQLGITNKDPAHAHTFAVQFGFVFCYGLA